MYLPKSNIVITIQHLKNIATLSAEQNERLLHGISDPVVLRSTAVMADSRASPAQALRSADTMPASTEDSGETARSKAKKKTWQRQPHATRGAAKSAEGASQLE